MARAKDFSCEFGRELPSIQCGCGKCTAYFCIIDAEMEALEKEDSQTQNDYENRYEPVECRGSDESEDDSDFAFRNGEYDHEVDEYGN